MAVEADDGIVAKLNALAAEWNGIADRLDTDYEAGSINSSKAASYRRCAGELTAAALTAQGETITITNFDMIASLDPVVVAEYLRILHQLRAGPTVIASAERVLVAVCAAAHRCDVRHPVSGTLCTLPAGHTGAHSSIDGDAQGETAPATEVIPQHRVRADYALGGWSKTVSSRRELADAVLEGVRLSPIARVQVERCSDPRVDFDAAAYGLETTPAPVDEQPCEKVPISSRVCELGTPTCVTRHKAAVPPVPTAEFNDAQAAYALEDKYRDYERWASAGDRLERAWREVASPIAPAPAAEKLAREMAECAILRCRDCGLPYAEFPLDTHLPDEQWRRLVPESEGTGGGGVLCAACIVARAAKVPDVTVVYMSLVPAAEGLDLETLARETAENLANRMHKNEWADIGSIVWEREAPAIILTALRAVAEARK